MSQTLWIPPQFMGSMETFSSLLTAPLALSLVSQGMGTDSVTAEYLHLSTSVASSKTS